MIPLCLLKVDDFNIFPSDKSVLLYLDAENNYPNHIKKCRAYFNFRIKLED